MRLLPPSRGLLAAGLLGAAALPALQRILAPEASEAAAPVRDGPAFRIPSGSGTPAECRRGDFTAAGREVARLVRDRFFDADAGRRWAERNRDFGRGATSPREFAAEANRLLAELNASHTGLYTPDDWMHHALAAVFRLGGRHRHTGLAGIGADVALTLRGAFVRRVFAGGPAERAGLRRGDEIVSVDGDPFHPVLSFRGKEGREAVLAVRRRDRGPLGEVRASVRRIPLPREWLDAQRQGSRVVRHRGRRIAVIPLFVGAGEACQAAAREALRSPAFQQADALVLDLRDSLPYAGGRDPQLERALDLAAAG